MALRRSCKSQQAFTISPSFKHHQIKTAPPRKKRPFLILVDWAAGREPRSTNRPLGRFGQTLGCPNGVKKALWLFESLICEASFGCHDHRRWTWHSAGVVKANRLLQSVPLPDATTIKRPPRKRQPFYQAPYPHKQF
jgi:hypothetical protein